MKNYGSNHSNVGMEIALFERLRSTVQEAGVPVEGARGKALAYFVRANHNIYGDQCRVIVDRFIEDLERLKKQSGNNIACEISWTLDRGIQVLFKTEMVALSLSNPKLVNTINAISGLYMACKSRNDELHAKSLIVNFSGIPGDRVPEWYEPKFSNSQLSS